VVHLPSPEKHGKVGEIRRFQGRTLELLQTLARRVDQHVETCSVFGRGFEPGESGANPCRQPRWAVRRGIEVDLLSTSAFDAIGQRVERHAPPNAMAVTISGWR